MAKNCIKLHPEYGVNPSMSVCFYCGEPTNEIVLFGAAYKDKDGKKAEAPRYTCNSLEPCDTCKEKYKEYVLIVEAENEDNPKPTGRWLAIKKSILHEQFRNSPIAFMEVSEFSRILKEWEELKRQKTS